MCCCDIDGGGTREKTSKYTEKDTVRTKSGNNCLRWPISTPPPRPSDMGDLAVARDYAARFRRACRSPRLMPLTLVPPKREYLRGHLALIKLLQEKCLLRDASLSAGGVCFNGLDVPALYLENQTRYRDGKPCRRSVEEAREPRGSHAGHTGNPHVCLERF